MGMYTTMEDNINLKVEEDLIQFYTDVEDCYINGDSLYKFLVDVEPIKFYGYWGSKELEFLNKVGKKGFVKGEFTCQYEEGDFIKCKFDEDGFHYSIGRVVFEKWEQ